MGQHHVEEHPRGFGNRRQSGPRPRDLPSAWAEGFRVVLTARDARQGRAAAERLAMEKIDVAFRSLDVSDASSIAALAKELIVEGVKFDVLVNNAAVALDGFDGAVARNTIAINFLGPLRVTDALLGVLVDGSNIVMVSSGAGELSGFPEVIRKKFLDPGLTRDRLVDLMASFVKDVEEGRYRRAGWPASAYRVSKAGLNALVRILAADLLLEEALFRISRARGDSGTRCSLPAFILVPGTVHRALSKSISLHSAKRASPDRAAVKIVNSRSLETRECSVGQGRTVATREPTTLRE